MKVIGIQKDVRFKMDGNEFIGINIFGTVPRDGVEGFATEKLFINSTKQCYSTAIGLKVNDDINVYYNRYGKVDTIIVNK